jgi:hypothetical protein
LRLTKIFRRFPGPRAAAFNGPQTCDEGRTRKLIPLAENGEDKYQQADDIILVLV